MKKSTNSKGITLVALVITIIILLILAGITISQLTSNGLLNNAQQGKEKTEKQTATEIMNFKITNIQIESYVENKEMPSLQYLADKLCEDKEMEYVLNESKVTASLDKIVVGENTSIFTKLKQYPYEFEINSSLQLASIDGVKMTNSNPISNNDVAYKVYLDEEEINYIPTKEDGHYFLSISCTEGATATWDNEEWGPNIRNLTSPNTVCTINFYSFAKLGREWLEKVGLDYDSYGSVKNVLLDADACNKLMSSESALEVLCNNEDLIEEVCNSTIAKNALYNNASITENILANSATALKAIKNSSKSKLVSVNGNAESNNTKKTLYNGKAFVLSYSHNGKNDGTTSHGSYINGSSFITVSSGDSLSSDGTAVKVNKFASTVQAYRSSYSSSGHGTFKYYAIILPIDE